MFSKYLSRSIDISDVSSIDPEDVAAVCDEAACCLSKLNANLRSFSSQARATGKYLSPQDWQRLNLERADAAALHQSLLSRRRQIRILEEEARRSHADDSPVPDAAVFFMQVVRNEAKPADYQRWILQAELRRSAEIRRQLSSVRS